MNSNISFNKIERARKLEARIERLNKELAYLFSVEKIFEEAKSFDDTLNAIEFSQAFALNPLDALLKIQYMKQNFSYKGI